MTLTKNEVEEDIRDKGDFVKLDHLKRFLLRADNLDVKRFIMLKLASVYETHNFYLDAARCISSAAEMSVNPREKTDLYMKEIELWIKSEQFEMADKAFIKAAINLSLREKGILQEKYFGVYMEYAKKLENEGKNRRAVEVYAKLYNLPLLSDAKSNVKQKLSDLYLKLGRTTEYYRLNNVPESQHKSDEFKFRVGG